MYGSAGSRWMTERLSTSATASDNEQHMSQQPIAHRHQRHPHYGADEDEMDDQYNPSGKNINNKSYFGIATKS